MVPAGGVCAGGVGVGERSGRVAADAAAEGLVVVAAAAQQARALLVPFGRYFGGGCGGRGEAAGLERCLSPGCCSWCSRRGPGC